MLSVFVNENVQSRIFQWVGVTANDRDRAMMRKKHKIKINCKNCVLTVALLVGRLLWQLFSSQQVLKNIASGGEQSGDCRTWLYNKKWVIIKQTSPHFFERKTRLSINKYQLRKCTALANSFDVPPVDSTPWFAAEIEQSATNIGLQTV